MQPEANERTVKNRTRSPSYPTFGLEEAIRKARILYDEEDHHPIPVDAVAEHWSYAPKSSGLLQGISALKQFGLLNDEGSGPTRRVRLSDLAMDILLQEDGSAERAAAIREAALHPKVHRELWEKYGGKLPSADSSIRYYLLREREEGVFNKDYVDSFIAQFRSTIAFAGLEQSDKMAGSGGDQPRQEPGQTMTQRPPSTTPRDKSASPASTIVQLFQNEIQPYGTGTTHRELPITLPSLEIAVLRLPVPMSQRDYSTLVNSLTAMKDSLVRETPDEEAAKE